MIMLYRGLEVYVFEYGSNCFSGMAITHMLRLERDQYRGIRIALGLMCSTPNHNLEVLSGKAPLAERFLYLNFRYVVTAFYRLEGLNLGRCIAGYSIPMFCHWIWFHLSQVQDTICRRSWLLILWDITWKGHFPGFRYLCIRWWRWMRRVSISSNWGGWFWL
jgi:hypothetical protein